VLAMAFTLVYTGEHFVLDEVVGWSYAVFVYFVGSHVLDRLAAWRAARRQGGHDPAEPDSTPPARPAELEVLQADSAVG
jgi:hypothetical protein